jgi:type II secretory pathway pseudopilin PulG
MLTPRRMRPATRAGFTLLELSIGAILLLILTGAVLETLGSMKRMALVGSVQSRAQAHAERALTEIVRDLRRSGIVELGGLNYPYFIEDGLVPIAYDPDEVHSHLPAQKAAAAGDPDFGADRGMLLVLPALWPEDLLSLDPEQKARWPYGRPVLHGETQGTGPLSGAGGIDPEAEDYAVMIAPGETDPWPSDIVWDVGNPISYTLRTDNTGRNVLERRESRGSVRALARDVERVVFENSAATGFQIPLDAVRVRIFFRVPDENRRIYRFQMEATVRLRNGTGI